MKFIKLFLIIFFLFCGEISASELQEKFHDWSFFKSERGDKSICYLASTPIKQIGNYDKRGEPFFLVTNIENDADEISVSAGFYYAEKSDVEVSFGSKKFYLFPFKSLAWAFDKNDDINIIKEMQKQEEITVTGVARDGKISSDLYSLIGFNLAYQKMQKNCK